MPTRTARAIVGITTVAVGLLACDASSSTSPPLRSTLILGDFGGNDSQLHADSTAATLNFHCSTVMMRPGLASDSTGALATSGQRRRNGGVPPLPGEAPTPVRITGRAFVANGGSLRIIVTPIPDEAGATAGHADTLMLVRGRASTLFLCP
jgi:hypothetical protein